MSRWVLTCVSLTLFCSFNECQAQYDMHFFGCKINHIWNKNYECFQHKNILYCNDASLTRLTTPQVLVQWKGGLKRWSQRERAYSRWRPRGGRDFWERGVSRASMVIPLYFFSNVALMIWSVSSRGSANSVPFPYPSTPESGLIWENCTETFTKY